MKLKYQGTFALLSFLAAAGCGGASSEGGFVDEKGRQWLLVGDATFTDDTVASALGVEPDESVDLDQLMLDVTLEEAAQMLRPRLELDGKVYTVSLEDSMVFARRVREKLLAKTKVDEPARYAEGVTQVPDVADTPSGDAVDDTDREWRKIIPGYGSWYRINSSADNWPYTMIATLDQGGGRCTAFKAANHHTAVTAGHCVATSNGNWRTRQRIQFAAGSGNTSASGSGDERNYLPSGCYGRVTPGCFTGVGVCDYAVFYLRGKGAWCNYADYNTGYFGYQTVSSNASSVQTRMGSYPGTPPSGGYPSLFYHNRSDGWASGNHLRYRIDTLPGSSGAPTFNSSNQVRSVHSDACGSGSCTYNYGMRMTTTIWEFIKEYGGI